MATRKTTANRNTSKTNSTKKVVTVQSALNEVTPLVLTIGGIIGANFLGNFIDKAIKADEGSAIKKFAKPIILTIGGVAIKLFVDNKNIKSFGDGVAISGMLSAVKIIDKNNVLSGAEGFGNVQVGETVSYENVPIQLSIDHEQYNPDLPMLESDFSNEDTENEIMSGNLEEINETEEVSQEAVLTNVTTYNNESNIEDLGSDEIEII